MGLLSKMILEAILKMSYKAESKHFSKLWELIELAINEALEECSSDFIKECGLVQVDGLKLKKSVETTYRRLRERLKRECYGVTDNGPQSLDARKIAAVICCTLIAEKALAFDEDSAAELLEKKETQLIKEKKSDRTALNEWIVNNFFVNYKIAYLSGLRIIYRTLLAELVHTEATKKAGERLNEKKCLFCYPRVPKLDNFDVNMVLGLGRSDIQQSEINLFMLALQYYQIEMYTRQKLGLDN